MNEPATVGSRLISPSDDWIVARYPAGYRFAFTIVHDADSGYSRRLAPLFDVFDELGLRITVSAFAFWASWARSGSIWSEWTQSPDPAERRAAPKAVPFSDPEERRFYQDLAARGHEIALHTPSDTSSTREEVVEAFDLFKVAFGHYPTVYVEHSSRANKDAQGNEGADPDSPYYCRDLLAQYDPWIWVDGPGGLRSNEDGQGFQIPPTAPFADRDASTRYGFSKTFVRTGGWRAGDGDGFLRCYSVDNIESLERDGGVALVYTHLDKNWLDPATGQMRSDVRARLEHLAARPGWFVPAGEILDRARAVESIQVTVDANAVTLRNSGATPVDRILVRAPVSGREVVIASIGGAETRTFGHNNGG